MIYPPRYYQSEVIDKDITYLRNPKLKDNGISVMPTGSGKSLVIAHVAKELTDGSKIILQPSKEILEQNYEKYTAYGGKASIYSAAFRKKEVSDITFATIGSIINVLHLFKDVKYALMDECHLANASGGMYETFFSTLKCRAMGFTASPYRLSTDSYGGSQLKFITRTRPKIFKDILAVVQNKPLFDQGYLARLQYHSIPGFDQFKVPVNSTGAGYDERALKNYYKTIKFPEKLLKVVNRLREIGRKNCLIFTQFLDEAEYIAERIPGIQVISGDTPTKQRTKISEDFKAGLIWGVITVGVWVTGFDYPALKTVVLASPMMSLEKYYQKIGRIMRPFEDEDGWVVDMCDNIGLFGKIEDLEIRCLLGKWSVWNMVLNKQLTNNYFNR